MYPIAGPPGRPLGFNGQSFWLSWTSRSEPQLSWEKARAKCQEFCMDLVVIENKETDDFVSDLIKRSRLYGVWTGGQKCKNEQCMSPDRKNVWVWEPPRRFISHDRYRNWSNNGAKGQDQPDDFDSSEDCLAVLNDWYEDGVAWHDLQCEDHLPFICQSA